MPSNQTATANTSKPNSEPKVASTASWSVHWRVVASVLLLLHLTAIVVAPLSNPPPASMLSQVISGWFEPYLAGADLNHGYRFFAPDPGASSLVRYELIMPDGSREAHQFPAVEEHWPRLIYHRHFMIAETINSIFRQVQDLRQPLELPPISPELPERERQNELARRQAIEQDRLRQLAGSEKLLAELLEGVGQELLVTSGAERVELNLVTHHIAEQQLVAFEGVTIDDARWYESTPLGSLGEGESWTWSKESYEPATQRVSP